MEFVLVQGYRELFFQEKDRGKERKQEKRRV